MKVQEFFSKHRLFSFEEFAEFMEQQGLTRPETWRQELSYHYKVGNLIRIKRGLYATKSKYEKESEVWIDPYLVAGKAAPNAILCHHTALELHGYAYTTFTHLTFFSDSKLKPFTYSAQTYKPIMYPKVLGSIRKEDKSLIHVIREGVSIAVTNLERTIVDILDRPELAGGWEEVWRSLDNLPAFDQNALIEYTLRLKNATTVSKVGYFLENRPAYLSAEEKYINKLLSHVPKNPHYMNRDRSGKGKYIERWNLIVPLEIINKTWEEPYVDNI